MVSVHELAEIETDSPRSHLVLLQVPKESIGLVRCRCCDGLRSLARRNESSEALCKDCRSGRVTTRMDYFGWWEERFTPDEIEGMAKAIWG